VKYQLEACHSSNVAMALALVYAACSEIGEGMSNQTDFTQNTMYPFPGDGYVMILEICIYLYDILIYLLILYYLYDIFVYMFMMFVCIIMCVSPITRCHLGATQGEHPKDRPKEKQRKEFLLGLNDISSEAIARLHQHGGIPLMEPGHVWTIGKSLAVVWPNLSNNSWYVVADCCCMV
jgi:hypothetical protein